MAGPFREIDGQPYADWWRERFDPAADPLGGLRFYQRGRSLVWVGSASIDGLAAARTDAVGVPLLRIGRRFWKPTSVAIVAFGGGARRNAIDLDDEEAAAFFAGDSLSLRAADPRRAGLSRGFLVARYHGVALGCAEYLDDTVVSLVPTARRLTGIDM